MEFTTHDFFAAGAILLSFMRSGTYLYAIYRGKARPHLFSWVNWGILGAIAAVAQFHAEGGASAWVLVATAGLCFLNAFLAIFIGEKNITRSDWFAFLSALAVIPFWQLSKDPLLTFALLIFIDTASYYPTYRKSWNDPWGEPPGSYMLAGTRYFLMILAIPAPTLDNLIYPVFLMVTDWGFALFLLWRRRALCRATNRDGASA